MKIIEVILGVFAVIFAILGTVCSSVIVKYTPYVTVVLVALDLFNVVSFSVWTIIGYGILTYICAWIILGINILLLAFLGAKIK